MKSLKKAKAGGWLRAVATMAFSLLAASTGNAWAGKLSLSFQNVGIGEVMQMISRQERVNILVSQGVEAMVSVNLYDVELNQAIQSIAAAGGYAVEQHDGSYFIVPRDEVGQYSTGDMTELRTYKVQYSDPALVEAVLKKHLSRYGKITNLTDRQMLVIEDQPAFLDRVERLLKSLDQEPRQILIEAKIFEITLKDSESFGIDWKQLFTVGGKSKESGFGTQGLANSENSPGLFFKLMTPSIEVLLNALETRGRLRTLSTPKLLAMENQEAETVVGDRIGFKVTTTINQVTTESIEFLESGVILRVTPSVDQSGRIMLDIHPEVSTGSVSDDGVPSKSTTQVSTRMLVPDGQTVFIGGLIKHAVDESREGVPVLGDLPGVGLLFSNRSRTAVNTETVVLITPKIIDQDSPSWSAEQSASAKELEKEMVADPHRIDNDLEQQAPTAKPQVRAGTEPASAKRPVPKSGNWLSLSSTGAEETLPEEGTSAAPPSVRNTRNSNSPLESLNY